MSVFRVKLNQGTGRLSQGYLDTFSVNGYSLQRTVSLPGPNHSSRELKDGDTFTDVNYWKRFVYPNMPYETAVLEVVTDDGSYWSDNAEDNVFPRSYSVSIGNNTAYEDNVVDVLGDNGSPAIFTQITVATGGTAPTFRFNSQATMSIGNNTTQVFDKGDLQVTYIEIDNTQSGHAAATADIFMSIKSIPQS